MPGIEEILMAYGPLGLMVLIGIYVSRKLFLLLGAERIAHTEKIETLTTDYAAEVKKLNEDHQRELAVAHKSHADKAEEWVKGYHDLANSLNATFEGVLRRIRRED